MMVLQTVRWMAVLRGAQWGNEMAVKWVGMMVDSMVEYWAVGWADWKDATMADLTAGYWDD